LWDHNNWLRPETVQEELLSQDPNVDLIWIGSNDAQAQSQEELYFLPLISAYIEHQVARSDVLQQLPIETELGLSLVNQA
jgi:hypothetical protein